MCLRVSVRKKNMKKTFFASLKSLRKGIGSKPDPDPLIRDADPDLHQNVMDPQYWFLMCIVYRI
jgi:hypothetical protein